MADLTHFAIVALLTALAALAAIASTRLAAVLRAPAPALLLAVAALAGSLVPSLQGLDVITDQRIVTIALVVILLDGGMHIGWSRLRGEAVAVAWLGIAGTVVTAGALALVAHALFGFGWRSGLLVGTALAPTDPAVVFSVLGKREIVGRAGTLLEGESGANDPVGIALMVSLLGASGSGWAAVGSGVGHFALQLGVGAAVGGLGGWLLVQALRSATAVDEALYPVLLMGWALALYGAAAAAQGSGFLAVFVAGIIAGDAEIPHRRGVRHTVGVVAALAEMVAFVVLGLSIRLPSVFAEGRVWTALGMAALLVLVIRPVLVGAVLVPVRLARGERLFVLLAGLKGAVPILLGTYVVAAGARDAQRIYDVVFVVVLVTVVVQGGLVPAMARVFGISMRADE